MPKNIKNLEVEDKSDHDLSRLELLINSFKLSKSSITKLSTIYEIAGFPSRENVYSNVLKFYLDSRREHQFGTSILYALLNAAGVIKKFDLEVVEIKREAQTPLGGFIDIIVRTKDLAIAIENKVYHEPSNNFIDYSTILENRWRGMGKENYIQIILALFPERINVPDWKVVSYKNFITNLSEVLANLDTSNIYHLYLADFVKNIKNHLIFSDMTTQQVDFVSANEEAIGEVAELFKLSNSYLIERRNNIFKPVNTPNPYWEKSVYDYEITVLRRVEKETIKVFCTLEISNIYIELDRNSLYYDELKQVLEENGLKIIQETGTGALIKNYKPVYIANDEALTSDINRVISVIEAFIAMSLIKQHNV